MITKRQSEILTKVINHPSVIIREALSLDNNCFTLLQVILLKHNSSSDTSFNMVQYEHRTYNYGFIIIYNKQELDIFKSELGAINMADRRYDSWSTEKLQNEILRVRLINLSLEYELCNALTEKAKLENNHYALAFSYTFLSDFYLASKDNKQAANYLNLSKVLSEAAHYEDLLARIYNFYGLFYNSISDEISALDYYLKALDFAEEKDDYIQMASAYNNIATCFDVKHNYKQAILYYQKCYDVMHYLSSDTEFSKAVALTNLCRCAYIMKKADNLDKYLSLFQEIDINSVDVFKLLYVYCVSMKLHLSKDLTAFYQTVDEILLIKEKIENLRLLHQVFTNICEMLLEEHNKEYSLLILKLLADINQKADIKTKKELQKLNIRYCEYFESKDIQLNAYEEFYKIINAIEEIELETYSSGLSAKLELHQTKVKKKNLEKENEHLEKLMNIDDLTGTANRRCFNHDINNIDLITADKVAIAMLDIDYFKEYNDIYGHQKGDTVLIAVGEALNSIKSNDIHVYRYGGDEFSIIFINQSEDTIQKLLNQIQQNIRLRAIKHEGSKTDQLLTISHGYAYTEEKPRDIIKLLEKADNSLYAIKKKRDQNNTFN